MTYRNIMMTYATPERDTLALQAALELAYQHEADLTVVHITGQCDKAECARHYLYSGQEVLSQVEKANSFGVPVTLESVDCGGVVVATASQAEKFDLIVISDDHCNCFENSGLEEKLVTPRQIETMLQNVA